MNRWYSGLLSGSLPGTNMRSPTDLAMHFASEQNGRCARHYEAKLDPVAFRRLNIDGTTAAGATLARCCLDTYGLAA